MTPSQVAKKNGLKSLEEACKLTGEKRQFFYDLHKRKPIIFEACMVGLGWYCVAEEKGLGTTNT